MPRGPHQTRPSLPKRQNASLSSPAHFSPLRSSLPTLCPPHLRDPVEGLSLATAHQGKVPVHVCRNLACPYRSCDNHLINPGNTNCARPGCRFDKKRVFNNVPGMPGSLRGTMRTSSASSRRARLTATRSMCPFRKKTGNAYSQRAAFSTRHPLPRDVSFPFHQHFCTDRCEAT
jgi:hypothetical protein